MNEFEYIASLEAEKERVKALSQKVVDQMAVFAFSDLENEFANNQVKLYAKLNDILAVRIALAKERISKDAWEDLPLVRASKEVS